MQRRIGPGTRFFRRLAFLLAFGEGLGGGAAPPPINLSEADKTAPQARHQKAGILSDARFPISKSEPSEADPIWEGGATEHR